MFERIVRHGTLMTVVVLIITLLGVLAALRIPVQMIPDLEVRTISVVTSWPGATPQDVEKEILIEQEEYLRNLPNLRRMTSSAGSGEAEIELEFPFGVDITDALIRVNNALSQVPAYPDNVDQPRILSSSFSSNAFMYYRVSPLPDNPRGLDMDMMQDFIDDEVRSRMESVAGVSQVEVRGGAERQVQLLLDAQKLAQFGLSVVDVRDALRERNRDVSGGELESGKRRYLLRTVGRFKDIDSLNELILVRSGDSLVRLKDVATVVLDHFPVRSLSRVNGEPVISLAVRRETGSNVIDIKYAMFDQVVQINREVLEPAGMRMALIADDVRYVEASVANVWTNLAIGAVFATLVMFLFLRSVKITAVGVIGIPICTIAAFLGLLVAGRTINVISLAGIAFAIGMTLDNSIVVLESIEMERRKGLDRFRAAVSGIQKVWPAVFASTMTTVLVFLPVVFIQEEAGQLYSDIAIAVSASILVSMLVAMTVIPTLSARLDFSAVVAHDGQHSRWMTALHRLSDRLSSSRPRQVTTLLATLLMGGAIVLFLTPPAEYLPEGEEPKTFASMSAPPGYNLSTMKAIADEVEAEFLPLVGADPADYESGELARPPMKYVNMGVDAERLRIIAEPVDPAHMEAMMDAITEVYQRYPGMGAFAARGSIISSNDGGTRSVTLDVAGADLAEIYTVASRLEREAEQVFDNPRIQSQPASLSLAQPLIEVHPRWNRAAEVQFSTEDLGFTVAALTDGAYLDEFFLGDDKIDIYAYSHRTGTRPELAALPGLPVHTPIGATVPLSSLATLKETVDTSVVRRVNGRRTVTLNIIPPRGVALETGVSRVRGMIQQLRDAGEIPDTISITLSGASDQLQATQESLSSNYVVALMLVYLLLVAIFTHWGFPLLIMTTIPLGIASGLLGLAMMNGVGALLPVLGLPPLTQPFDMITMLGFLILMGTVVNNPILIVHQATLNFRENAMSAVDAVNEAVASRLRPIAMTTITTVCGLAPLVLIPGEGTELYQGVGAIVLFGLLGTAIVTITFLPALTALVLSLFQKRV
ncbi:efflux RND transporter permease subunit [uncultured Alcanivorax sp.]|uniref:efflux RND transporter permease subunit n=1 Tax=uncultured Alcanivorax sp. TaxID=191215 RepID=UPI002633DF45|nr:efflux RND transporter permease subunit [uncultured Alcanivorax sp.]